MAHKEIKVVEVYEVLRRHQMGDKKSAIARGTGIDRKTVRKYIRMAEDKKVDWAVAAKLEKVATEIGIEIERSRSGGHQESDVLLLLEKHKEKIRDGLEKESLTLTKIQILLVREGINIPYSSLHRFAQQQLGFGKKQITVCMAPTAPGEVAEVDFGQMGYIVDGESKQRRLVHGLLVTLGCSRHQFVFLTHKQDLKVLIEGLELAWEYFGGVTVRVIIDNLKAAVIKAGRCDSEFNRLFFEYAQYRGFIIDNTNVRHPQGKPKVERNVPYVRENFFRGETFLNLEHAQGLALCWCSETAGLRIHGTTQQRPRLVFEAEEQAKLIPLIKGRFDIPEFATPIVHRDHSVCFKKSFYTVPTKFIGKQVDLRADSQLVRIYWKNELIKTHPRQQPGAKSIDPSDYPSELSPYAMRDVNYYKTQGQSIGSECGAFMGKLLDGDFPWSKIRQAQALLGLAKKYGPQRVNDSCNRAYVFDVINVKRVESMIKANLDKPSEYELERRPDKNNIYQLPLPRFARAASEFNHHLGG